MENLVPKWYSNFGIYVDFINEINNIYINKINLSFEKRYENPVAIIKPVINVSTLISRIIPFKTYEQREEIKIIDNENIDYLTQYLPFIHVCLKEISIKHNKVLFVLGLIRNKYEHLPHLVEAKTVVGSLDSTDILYKLPAHFTGEMLSFTLGTDEIAYLIMDINCIISKVAKFIVNKVEKNHKKFINYPYHKYLKDAIELDKNNLLDID